MEQLSLFDFLIEAEKKEEIVFTSETQEELMSVISQAIIDVYKNGRIQNETNKDA